MLPELKNPYSRSKPGLLEVVAISIDTSEITLNNLLQSGNYSWINYSDFKGWAGRAASAYNISGTPTFFILDKSKKIISKPFDIEELGSLGTHSHLNYTIDPM